MIFKIINPSDPYTLEADTLERIEKLNKSVPIPEQMRGEGW